MADFTANRPIQERVNDALIYILAQNSYPTLDNWWDAIDDLFGEFDCDGKMRIMEVGNALLRQVRQPSRPKPRLLLTDLRKEKVAA